MPRASDHGDRSPHDSRVANSKRVFQIARPEQPAGNWYFQAREGTYGPFRSREKAETQLARLIRRNQGSDTAWARFWGLLLGRRSSGRRSG